MLFDRKRTHSSSLLIACAIASALAAVFLLLMPFAGHPLSRQMQMMIWSGTKILSPQELLKCTTQFYRMFSLVSVYLIGHFLMWLGYSYIIYRKLPLMGIIILIIGIFSTFTDMTEYMMRLAMWNGVREGIQSSSTFMFIWWSIREFSIWIFFMGTVVVAILFLGRSWINWTVSLMGLLGLVTIPCMYIGQYSMLWFTWLVLWHLLSGIVIYTFRSDTDTFLIQE